MLGTYRYAVCENLAELVFGYYARSVAREVRSIGITAPFEVLLAALRDIARAVAESAKPREITDLAVIQQSQSDWVVDPSKPVIDERGVRCGGTGI